MSNGKSVVVNLDTSIDSVMDNQCNMMQERASWMRSLDLTGSLSVLALGSDLGRNIDINESSGVADWVYTS